MLWKIFSTYYLTKSKISFKLFLNQTHVRITEYILYYTDYFLYVNTFYRIFSIIIRRHVMNLLDKVTLLCNEKGISRRKMERDIGISNGASSKWANSSPNIEIIKKLSDYFDVSTDYFFSDHPSQDSPLNKRDERDIAMRLESTLSALNSQEGLMFSGEPLDETTRELLKVSLESSLRIGKVNAKQKFTPKKYRSSDYE